MTTYDTPLWTTYTVIVNHSDKEWPCCEGGKIYKLVQAQENNLEKYDSL